MILTLILLLVMIAAAALVIKRKSKSEVEKFSKNSNAFLPEVDLTSIHVEESIKTIEQPKEVVQSTDQPKKKRKYHKKKHPKKMDANKK